MKQLELFDLYTILQKRKVTLEEWLSFNQINSFSEFKTKGKTAAGHQGCYISKDMEEMVEILFQKKISNMDIKPEVKKKKTKTKNSLNDSPSVLESEVSNEPINKFDLLDKENLDESNKS